MIRHRLIRASAGTGKTYELTSRYIALLREGATPSSILATTFTRKAAGEILERLLRRLAKAAQDDTEAATLDANVAQCRDMLAEVCRDLHRVSISTIDAFFAKMARCFQHELELPPDPRMVGTGDPQEVQIRRQAIDTMLADSDLSAVLDLIQRLYHDSTQRSVTDFLDGQVNILYDLYREAPHRDLWTKLDVPEGLSKVGFAAAVESLQSMLPDAAAEYGKRVASDLASLSELIDREDWPNVLAKGIAGQLAAGNDTYYGKAIPEDIAKRVRPFVQHARSELLGEVGKRTTALFDLLREFDAHFTELRERHHVLLFADLPHRLAHRMTFDEALCMEVYYRLDGRVAHLLLDEFQDTSAEQWAILRPFAQEITAHASPEEAGRSIFCVGDTKQAIYGWRGGCAEIFEQLDDDLYLPEDAAERRSKSYRSSQIVLDTVNQVFSDITNLTCLADFAPVTQVWRDHFEMHEANFSEMPGYVEMTTSLPEPTATDDDDADELAMGHTDFVAEHIAEIASHAPGKSIGVLVRTNQTASQLIDLLQRRGDVHASGEGGSAIDDDPAVLATLAALTLADHPGHTAAAYHIVNSPLGPIIELTTVEQPARTRAAQRIRAALIERGYAQTISAWARRLAPHCNERSVIRMTQLVELADQYESDMTLRPDDFVSYARATTVEEPTPAPVRVMTVHKAKGLEFDIVVLPELQKMIGQVGTSGVTVDRPQPTKPVRAVYSATNKTVRQLSPQLQDAYAQEAARRLNDDLCALYVAMTRARSALHMIVPPLIPRKDGTPRKVSLSHAAILREVLAREDESFDGNETLYRRGDPGWCHAETHETEPAPAQPAEPLVVRLAKPAKAPTRAWRQIAPSQLKNAQRVNIDDLLDLGGVDGRRYGTIIHEWFALIEYLPDDAPDDAQLVRAARRIDARLDDDTLQRWIDRFRRDIAQPQVVEALSKPSTGVKLWRERPFAVRIDGELMQGVFDRVLVTDNGAELLDFKTDSVEAGNVAAAAEPYRPQIDAYRRALAVMLDTTEDSIRARLLFVGAGETIDL